ncbi:MAG: hypothetical protein E7342_05355 [Clostridiales bacterium]|nr:hypothetical protein [Clostridiales bacterium]
MKENKINELIDTAIKNLNNLTDVNVIIGKPIKDEENVIIPICKATLGYLNGAGEYGKVKLFKKESEVPFAGGSGAVVSLKATGFLIKEDGKYRFISTSNEPIDKIVNFTSEFIENYAKNS